MAKSRSSTSTAARHECSGGFTLIEVLVALAILAVALAAILQIISTGLRSSSTAEAHAIATMFATSKLAGIGVEQPLEEREDTGVFDNGFEWQSSVSRYPTEADDVEIGSAVAVYRVVVTVHWGGTGSGRSVSLTTLRLAPTRQ